MLTKDVNDHTTSSARCRPRAPTIADAVQDLQCDQRGGRRGAPAGREDRDGGPGASRFEGPAPAVVHPIGTAGARAVL